MMIFYAPKGGPMDSEQKDVIKRIEEGAKPSKNSVSPQKVGFLPLMNLLALMITYCLFLKKGA